MRDDALKAFGALPTERVTAGGLKFEVRGLTVKDADDLHTSITKPDGEGGRKVDTKRWHVAWAMACTYDPETGEKLFDPADRDTLMGGANLPISQLGTVAAKLSGFGGDDVDAARELKSESA